MIRKGPRGRIKIMMIKVENLEQRLRWTFPKGHLENGETATAAALREVEEESGWKCVFLNSRKPKIFRKIQYSFQRNGEIVQKTVYWYLMKPLRKTRKPDAEEVLKTQWAALEKAEKIVEYASDQELLKRLRLVNLLTKTRRPQ